MSNFKSLKDIVDDEDEEQKKNTYYAGGEKSGIAIQGPGGKNKKRSKSLILWKNGFTVDESNLHPYVNYGNDLFAKRVKEGELPPELASVLGTPDEIAVDLTERLDDEWKPEGASSSVNQPSIAPFSGSGQRLGSGGGLNSQHVAPKTFQKEGMELDKSQPVTTIQIRLANGERLVGTFNHFHTVGDLRNYIYSNQLDSHPFDLMTTFPPKTLNDDSFTLKAAELLSSVVVQKFK